MIAQRHREPCSGRCCLSDQACSKGLLVVASLASLPRVAPPRCPSLVSSRHTTSPPPPG